MTLFRAKSAGVRSEEDQSLFFFGGAVYEEWRLKQLLELPGIIDIIQQISGTDYYENLQSVTPGFELSGRLHDVRSGFRIGKDYGNQAENRSFRSKVKSRSNLYRKSR